MYGNCFRFLSPNNQRVTDALIDQVYNDCSGVYNVKDIKRKSQVRKALTWYCYLMFPE